MTYNDMTHMLIVIYLDHDISFQIIVKYKKLHTNFSNKSLIFLDFFITNLKKFSHTF